MNTHGIKNHDREGNVIPLCILSDPAAPDVRECPHCAERHKDEIRNEVERMEWPEEL